ncbi:hypothetical protein ACFV1F_17075 [Streptomyces sp. NPDC059590]|uniref:hypothetical protein n=1 Tax=Streptomyces sp. NPDC059590 TaxID=3346877 RepID=UPI0036C04B20
MNDTITGLTIAAVLAAAAVLAWAAETRVRALWARPPATAEQDAAALTELLVDAEPGAFRWCPKELRTTYHAEHADGSRTCWTCRCVTPAQDVSGNQTDLPLGTAVTPLDDVSAGDGFARRAATGIKTFHAEGSRKGAEFGNIGAARAHPPAINPVRLEGDTHA